jgi:vacuolar-type H+-ATPase subunit E/Vma4
MPEAVAEFKKIMVGIGQPSPNPRVSLSSTHIPSKGCAGGVVLSACRGRILLNQTLDERLIIAYHDLMPQVRRGLFTTSA